MAGHRLGVNELTGRIEGVFGLNLDSECGRNGEILSNGFGHGGRGVKESLDAAVEVMAEYGSGELAYFTGKL